MKSRDTTIYIVDDDENIRLTLQDLFEVAGYEVLSYENGSQFEGVELQPKSSCVILDLQMPCLNGLELLEALSHRRFCPPIVMLTGQGDVPAAVTALRKGAFTFLEKPIDNQVLLDAVEEAIAYHSNDIEKAMAFDKLTDREREVAELVLQGKLNKQTAHLLNISEKTVEFHRKNIREKIDFPVVCRP